MTRLNGPQKIELMQDAMLQKNDDGFVNLTSLFNVNQKNKMASMI